MKLKKQYIRREELYSLMDINIIWIINYRITSIMKVTELFSDIVKKIEQNMNYKEEIKIYCERWKKDRMIYDTREK